MSDFDLIVTAAVSFEKVRGRRPACSHIAQMTGLNVYFVTRMMRIVRANRATDGVKPTRKMMAAARTVKVLSEEEINAKKAKGGVTTHTKAGKQNRALREKLAIERVVREAQNLPSVDVLHDYRRSLFNGRVRAVKVG